MVHRRKNRVDLLIPTVGIGGAERACVYLYKSLRSEFASVRIVTTSPTGLNRFTNEYTQLRYNNGLGVFAKILKIRQAILANQTDTVVVFLNHLAILTYVALLFTNVTLIVAERSNPFKSDRLRIQKLITPLVYRNAEAVVVQTHELSRLLFTRWGLTNIVVIPNAAPENGIAIKSVKPIATEIVCVARLIQTKNINLVIRSLRSFLKRGGRLTIYGDGPEKDALLDFVATEGLSDAVSIVSGEHNLQKIYASADAFITLSDLEGFPNSLLEAVSLGVPAIAYDCDFGPSEILDDGRVGLLLTSLSPDYLEPTIEKFLSDYDTRRRAQVYALRHVGTEYSREKVMTQWETLIKAL